ncbi:hypothetical protein [Fundicoccus culcitae]|uniref:Yip1 domain-containing protein n=1 Tax=Fundicoccus culcitae TaxID=2969821 RepID=A0ABY5P6U6_9LACT|nr:hypothetical protein [Fundicoccus culcitae]UUX34306.1 hypothetical protein NRE15_01140 [Fundicoccus culcitae]
MLLGNLHQSNVIILFSLFFGAVGFGFSITGDTQYALVSLIIATVASFFNFKFGDNFELTEEEISFALELEVLSQFVVFGMLPAGFLINITNGSMLGLLVMTLYLLAVAIRLAHYNRAQRFQGEVMEGYTEGVPLEHSVLIIPLVSLLAYLIDQSIMQYVYIVLYILLAAATVIRFPVPKLKSEWIWGILGVSIVVAGLLIWFGPLYPEV